MKQDNQVEYLKKGSLNGHIRNSSNWPRTSAIQRNTMKSRSITCDSPTGLFKETIYLPIPCIHVLEILTINHCHVCSRSIQTPWRFRAARLRIHPAHGFRRRQQWGQQGLSVPTLLISENLDLRALLTTNSPVLGHRRQILQPPFRICIQRPSSASLLPLNHTPEPLQLHGKSPWRLHGHSHRYSIHYNSPGNVTPGGVRLGRG